MTTLKKEFCVSDCYYLWDNVIWNLLNLELIGLSIKIFLSGSYFDNLEKHAM